MIKILNSLLIVQVFASVAMAANFTIEDGTQFVHINVDIMKITYKEKNFFTTIKRKKCNQFVFDNFKNRINYNSRELVAVKGSLMGLKPLRIKVGKKEKLALRHTKAGQFFNRLPSSVRNLYFTSERICKK